MLGKLGVPAGEAVLDACRGGRCDWLLGVGAELPGAVDGEKGVGVEGPEGEAAVLIALPPAARVSGTSGRSEVSGGLRSGQQKKFRDGQSLGPALRRTRGRSETF